MIYTLRDLKLEKYLVDLDIKSDIIALDPSSNSLRAIVTRHSRVGENQIEYDYSNTQINPHDTPSPMSRILGANHWYDLVAVSLHGQCRINLVVLGVDRNITVDKLLTSTCIKTLLVQQYIKIREEVIDKDLSSNTSHLGRFIDTMISRGNENILDILMSDGEVLVPRMSRSAIVTVDMHRRENRVSIQGI